jgi:hypothetical protein
MDFLHDKASNDAGLTIFKVGASTVPIALAEAIARVLRQQDVLEIQAMGAAAVYRATHALCIARVLIFVGLIFEVETRPCTGVPPIRLDRN